MSTRPETPMTVERLETMLRKTVGDVKGRNGRWSFVIEGIPMAIVTDVHYDRMRIIAPIIRVKDVSDEQRSRMLEANFHTALDARYGTSNGVVYAAYIHPLSPLTEGEFLSALQEVATLAAGFGTTYSSGMLRFGRPTGPAPGGADRDEYR